MALRGKVIELYKNLYHMGKEYPKGADWFHQRLKMAFLKNRTETDPKKIEELIERGNFVIREIEALYKLRKYRAMKQRYYEVDEKVSAATKKFEDDVNKNKKF
ncbi:unnamed protein product [Caenorhabditis bovis]|uniref:Complex 1 LYR protein domain-containing protein n=1 Tax=Caenorhabditis bovis TaxID=2654633 RepID=A0A8S1E7A0_9PELO|nr:unnamed protein product [Caenorhabditis bovis]